MNYDELRNSRDLVPDSQLLGLMQLASEYWTRADGVRNLSVSELFTETGVLTLGSLRVTGRAAIEAFFQERAAGQRATQRVRALEWGVLESVRNC